MFDMFAKKYVIQDLQNLNLSGGLDMKQLRRKVEILFVDDAELPILESLRLQRFNIEHKIDIASINDVAGYDIILCDIRGVGQKFNSDKEGAYLIKQIKEMYPEKRIIAYTASTYDPSYNQYLELADNVIVKGVTSEVWAEIIDDQIKKSISPIYQWEKLREKLLSEGVDITTVSKLEHEYVKSIRGNDINSFEKFVCSLDLNDSVKKIIQGVITSILVKLFTGGLA